MNDMGATMRAASAISCLSLLLLVAPAQAQVKVSLANGNSLAYTCYVSALSSTKGVKITSDHVDDCTAALGAPMTQNIRAATFDNRGILYTAVHDIPAALDDFNASIRLNPALADAWLNRGVAFIRMGKSQDALEEIQHGIALGTAVPQIAYFDLGVAEQNLGHITAAYNDYRLSLASQADFAPAVDALKDFRVIPATADTQARPAN